MFWRRILFAGLLVFCTACDSTDGSFSGGYLKHVLLVNDAAYATAETVIIDPLLVNPWGTAIRPAGAGGHYWFANAGQARDANGDLLLNDQGDPLFTVTEYVGDSFDAMNGDFIPLFQDNLKYVPVDGAPVGQVFNGSPGFLVTGNLCSDDSLPVCDASVGSAFLGPFTGPSKFLVSTENGKIAGWTEGTIGGTFGRLRKFETIIDHSADGALYRGLAITTFPTDNWACAANFALDQIECYDEAWQPIIEVTNSSGTYTPFTKPPEIPNSDSPGKKYVPFSIHFLNERFYVAYAELVQEDDEDFDPEDPIAERGCDGCGYVAEFDPRGVLLRTFTNHGLLNAPWGMAIAPADFGEFSNALIVGNFGDGTLVGIDLVSGKSMGYLPDESGAPIEIEGLWGLFFGNGASLGQLNHLYWTAGFNDEEDGGFGSLSFSGNPVVPPTPTP